MPINVENMKNYIAGLRSGQLVDRQAFDTMNDGNGGFCALGLAALQMGHTPPAMKSYSIPHPKDHITSHLEESKVCEYLGLDYAVNICPECSVRLVGTEHIWHMNDEHRYTFAQIADFLEETFAEELGVKKQPSETLQNTPQATLIPETI